MNDHLHERLCHAADDSRTPLDTDVEALLVRARRERTRRRGFTAGAVVLTAAALVGATVGVRAALPQDGTTPAASEGDGNRDTRTSASTTLAASEVVRRCMPQLAKYAELPMYDAPDQFPAKEWGVVRARAYGPGDLVALQTRTGQGNPVLCVVPEKGHENDPVPFTDLDPDAARPARIAEQCSEMLLPAADPEQDRVPGRSRLPDLRGATVTAIDSDGPVVEALLTKGDTEYSCALSPMTWDAGPSGVGSTAHDGYEFWTEASMTGPAGKSITKENATYYWAAGTMPKDAASIEVTLENGSTFTVPVTDGHFAVVHKEPGSEGVLNYDYRVLDQGGRVLHEGTDRM
ncbi:hypothetical protein ASG90_16940 [Nocardioides sp. Soil797]|nr:hypothetical protein ASG90_16940 [Nocardioides sp. Soil797]